MDQWMILNFNGPLSILCKHKSHLYLSSGLLALNLVIIWKCYIREWMEGCIMTPIDLGGKPSRASPWTSKPQFSSMVPSLVKEHWCLLLSPLQVLPTRATHACSFM
jgi:hypothetical protein